jgi:hypothetical protein
MTKTTKFLAPAVAALALTALVPSAQASSHREALTTMNDPCIDNTDVYAWVDPGDHAYLNILAGVVPLHEPGQGNQQTRFCDDVLYQIHITRGLTDLRPELSYQIRFKSAGPTPVDEGDLSLPVGGGKELLTQLTGNVQTYTVTKVEGGTRTVLVSGAPVSPPNVGPRTDRIAYGLGPFNPADPASSEVGLYDDAFVDSFVTDLGPNGSEGQAWAGEADDPFYLDEKGIFDIINLHAQGVSEDVFDGFNLLVFGIRIPTTVALGTDAIAHNGTCGDDTLLGVWVTESRRQNRTIQADGNDVNEGPWMQVGREGNPLVNAGLIGTQDQTKFLRSAPFYDVANFASYFLSPILVRDLEAIGTYAALGVPQATIDALKSGRVDILQAINLDNIPAAGCHHVAIAPGKTGDVLRLDAATDSSYPNGRSLVGGAIHDLVGGGQGQAEEADVSDILITVIASGGAIALSDGVQYQDTVYRDHFPWIANAQQGLNEGHGATTP